MSNNYDRSGLVLANLLLLACKICNEIFGKLPPVPDQNFLTSANPSIKSHSIDANYNFRMPTV